MIFYNIRGIHTFQMHKSRKTYVLLMINLLRIFVLFEADYSSQTFVLFYTSVNDG